MKTKIKQPSPPNWHRYWIFRIVLVLCLSLLLYSGYCFGLWGRNSLLLHYLFQCNCPPSSHEARYPKQVDVVVPACRYAGSILSPSGRLLYIHEQDSSLSATHLLDLQTNEKIPFTRGEGDNYFLTDELLFRGYRSEQYILDRITGKQYPIQSFVFLRKDAYVNGTPNLEVLAIELQDAQDVYLIDNDTILALMADFQTSLDHNFFVDQISLPGSDPNRAEQFLVENGIDYQFVPGHIQAEAVSPDRRFIARADGIYLAGSGEKIVESHMVRGITGRYFSVQGWTYDSRGVIYFKFLDDCLLELPSLDGGTCSISVPQPLIKLKVPEEYLLPNEER